MALWLVLVFAESACVLAQSLMENVCVLADGLGSVAVIQSFNLLRWVAVVVGELHWGMRQARWI